MEASIPDPHASQPLPEGAALGYDPTKPLMTLGDMLEWPFGSVVAPDDPRDSATIARSLQERGDQRQS